MSLSLFIGTDFYSLYKSLSRYYYYCLDRDLICFTKDIVIDDKAVEQVLTFNSEKSLEESCDLLYRLKIDTQKLIIIGCDINLFEKKSLRYQIVELENNNENKSRIEYSFFNSRIKLFFAGHGEQSLLGCLKYAFYYLDNYWTLPLMGEYPKEELIDRFLLPGIQNWQEFSKRFEKYRSILFVGGWVKEVSQIEKSIVTVDNYVKGYEKSNQVATFDQKTIRLIHSIHELMEGMARQFETDLNETESAHN